MGFTQIDGERITRKGRGKVPYPSVRQVSARSFLFVMYSFSFLLGLNRHHDVNGERMEERRTVRRAQDSSQSTECVEPAQKDA